MKKPQICHWPARQDAAQRRWCVCWGPGQWTNPAPGVGKAVHWMQLLPGWGSPAAEPGSWGRSRSFSHSCLPWVPELSLVQRLVWSPLAKQSALCRVPGPASWSKAWMGGCGLRGHDNLQTCTRGLFRSAVPSQTSAVLCISWISSLIPLWSHNTPNDFSPLTFI